MKKYHTYLSLLTTILSVNTFGHSESKRDDRYQLNGFIENKKQWRTEIKYKAEVPGGVIFITDEGFVFNYVSQEDLDRMHNLEIQEVDLNAQFIRQHAYKVKFKGANANINYFPVGKKDYYHNYFIGNDDSKWAGKVSIYEKVIQKDIYSGIDLAIYSQGQSLKYDFIVAAASDVRQIALSYEGVNPTVEPDGKLRIQTSVNEIIEQAPYSYQIIDGREIEVKSAFILNDGIVSFSFPEGYNKNYPLIIDPELVFATFSGATSSNAYGHATTYDNFGNTYAAADAWSPGWPVTLGAFQTNYGGGGHEVAINKYNPDGTNLIYSTYFGGNHMDLPHSMKVNPMNELVLAGSTRSSDLPVTDGCYDSTLGGVIDMFVAHFSNDGSSLIGATYIGGSSNESFLLNFVNSTVLPLSIAQNMVNCMDLDIDGAGSIWVTGNTLSDDFPVTSNASQANKIGEIEGVVFQLNATCTDLIYSSYLGGSGNDFPTSLSINKELNIVIGGITGSSDFPTTQGAYQSTAPGGYFDGYICIINHQSGSILQSTYIGTDQKDYVTQIYINENNNIFVLGHTLGNYPITPGSWNPVADGDCFIDQFDPTLSSSIRSTRLGTSQAQPLRFVPSALMVDYCENIYIAGFGANHAFSACITGDAYQQSPSSFWLGVLSPGLSNLEYGSFFGSISDDHGHIGVNRMDPTGIVYHFLCKNNVFPNMPPGVWSPLKKTGTQDILNFKFDFKRKVLRAVIDMSFLQSDTVCAPATVRFLNKSVSPDSVQFYWNFDDGTTSEIREPSHTYTQAGVYDVVLKAYSDSACISSDSATQRIVVLQPPLLEISLSDTVACKDTRAMEVNVHINNPNKNTIQWGPPNAVLSGADSTTAIINPDIHQEYYVTVADISGFCKVSVTDTLRIKLMDIDSLFMKEEICRGETLLFNNRKLTSSGTYRDTLQNRYGCDSIVVLDLLVKSEDQEFIKTAMDTVGCTQLEIEGIIYQHDTLLATLYKNIYGCDSLEKIVRVKIKPSIYDTQFVHICRGETYEFDGKTYAEPVVVSSTFKQDLNCMHVTLVLDVAPKPQLTILQVDAKPRLCIGDKITLKGLGGENYYWRPDTNKSWDFSGTDYTFLLNEEHNIAWMMGLNSWSCADSLSVQIEAAACCEIFVPNAFSPNGDGLNDGFRAESRGTPLSYDLKIYDRLGNQVFQSYDIQQKWDGTYQNQAANPGVYFYIITGTCNDGTIMNAKGDLSLLR